MTRHTRKLPRYAATMKGVHEWYVSIFEKLGWMVIAAAKGKTYKIKTYKQSVDELIKTLMHIRSEYESQNRKHDLNVMIMNVEALKGFIHETM